MNVAVVSSRCSINPLNSKCSLSKKLFKLFIYLLPLKSGGFPSNSKVYLLFILCSLWYFQRREARRGLLLGTSCIMSWHSVFCFLLLVLLIVIKMTTTLTHLSYYQHCNAVLCSCRNTYTYFPWLWGINVCGRHNHL